MLHAIKNTVTVLKPGKKIPDMAPPAEPKKTAAAVPVKLLVWAVPLKNTKILIAYKKGDDPLNPHNLVAVNVRANFNFQPGMTLRVTSADTGGYDLAGALPRWRGRY